MPAIWIIGDSTVEDNKPPFRGWGWALPAFVREGVTVKNHALSGRSSRSFRAEGLFDPVEKGMEKDDMLLIQFGHNDEKAPKDRHTDPGSTFDYMLARYVRETREKGGIPVLMNCVVRRNFFVNAPENDDDEKLRTQTFKDGVRMVEGDSLIDTHGLYRVAPRDVAERMNVLLCPA